MNKQLKIVMNKLLANFGYKCVRLRETSVPAIDDRFSLNSGERQISTKLSGIRKDHIARYEAVSNFLFKHKGEYNSLFGADIFCGNGYGSALVTDKMKCFILGIDASKEAINLANKYYSNNKTFFITKTFPFKLPQNVFDFIISFETIEHLLEDSLLLQEFNYSLKKNGYLFLSAPNEEICSYEKNNYEFHIKHYTFSDILSIINKNGDFELISWYGNGACNFENGVNIGFRTDSEMELKEKQADSHITYVFKKI